MPTRSRRTGWYAIIAAASLVLITPMLALAAEADDLAAAEAGTEAFKDVGAAEDAGYALPAEGPLHECISSLDDTGAMGLHYINGDLAGDTELDPGAPEALVYSPTPDGGLELVALEYVVFAEAWDADNDAPPTLFEREFMFTDEPNRYELPAFYSLHAWVWKDNPSGTFTGFNPDVACPATEAVTPDTALSAPGRIPVLPLGIGLVLLALTILANERRSGSRQA